VACPTGEYCPLATTNPTPCPAGTYLNATQGQSAADCVACPEGQYCLLRSTVPTDCDAGSYRGAAGAQSQAQCTVCPSGNYCPQRSVAPTNCLAGTYAPLAGAFAADDCLACPAGKYCPLATTTPTSCQAGTYQPNVGGTAQVDCIVCPVGAYCPIQSITPTLCGPGRHRDTVGATHLSNCLLCLPGTYSTDVGRSSNCPVCIANYYCRTSTLKEACPTHTTALEGSYSRLNCKCTPGYQCTYYKQIQAIVTLNATLYDFNNDVGGVKTAFIAAMGAAANVSTDHVIINGVISHAASGARRLLSVDGGADTTPAPTVGFAEEFEQGASTVPPATPEPGSAGRGLLSVKDGEGAIRVFVSAIGTGRLHAVDKQLAKHSPTLHIANRWEPAHKVMATKL
jgi:hypothetical protein